MRRLLSFSLRSALLGGCLAAAAAPQFAWAQREGGAGIAAARDATEPSYVFPYFLMVLAIGLGLRLVGGPSRRKNLDEKSDAPE